MRIRQMLALAFVGGSLLVPLNGVAGLLTTTAREVGDAVFSKFGKGAAGNTADEIASATTNAVARHGNDAVPLLRKSGHAGFQALEVAGDKAPEVIKLYAKRGDEALWVISEPKRLAIFIKHGDSAADALIKHPGLADSLVERFGGDAATALTAISKPSAQRLGMVAEEGLLNASARSPELLPVIRMYGDSAMEFIWKNKGALAVASVLGTFLADPKVYISGAKELAVPVLTSINWTLLIAGTLVLLFLPFIARTVVRTRKTFVSTKEQ